MREARRCAAHQRVLGIAMTTTRVMFIACLGTRRTSATRLLGRQTTPPVVRAAYWWHAGKSSGVRTETVATRRVC
jgi:hypothetical protein